MKTKIKSNQMSNVGADKYDMSLCISSGCGWAESSLTLCLSVPPHQSESFYSTFLDMRYEFPRSGLSHQACLDSREGEAGSFN